MFGHLLFDEDVRPGLDVLLPAGRWDTPVSLLLDAEGSLTVEWLDAVPTDLGCINRAMIRAYLHHGMVDVTIGAAGNQVVRTLALGVDMPLAKRQRFAATANTGAGRRDHNAERHCDEDSTGSDWATDPG
jgi:hypothetical protein